MMECVIIYWSRYGHGEKLIGYLTEKLEKKEMETKSFKPDELDPKDMPEADFYIFSSPTEMFRIKRGMRKFMKKLKNMEGKKYGIINTHSMKRNWLKKMEKILKKKEMKKIAQTDFRIEKEGAEEGKGLPEGWEDRLDEFVDDILAKI